MSHEKTIEELLIDALNESSQSGKDEYNLVHFLLFKFNFSQYIYSIYYIG